MFVQSIASLNKNSEASSSDSFIAELSSFFPYCNLSYIGLITGYEVNRMTTIVVGGKLLILHETFLVLLFFDPVYFLSESEEDFASCLSYVNHGASLAGSVSSYP